MGAILATPMKIRTQLAVVAALGFALACPLPASAQGGHPMPRVLRPLHERLAEADLAVIATIGEIRPDRIELLSPTALVGDVTDPAELKRAPSAPLPLASGDRALLLLAGARSPYVAVDRPRETIRLADADAEARWREAIRVLDSSRDDPDAWVRLYDGWLDSGPGSLRDLALVSLADPEAAYQPLPDALFVARADAAWDPERDGEARLASARLAALRPSGAARLTARAARCDPDAPGGVVEISALAALRLGAPGRDAAAGRPGAPKKDAATVRLRAPDREAAALCSLGHPDAAVRAAALREIGRTGAPSEAVERRVRELATDDEDAHVREAARLALERRP